MIRRPSQAGLFYSSTSNALQKEIEKCFVHRLGPGRIPRVSERPIKSVIGVVSPHAGYMYSGPVAAHGFYDIGTDGKPDAVVILGPNHYGLGSALSIMTEGSWRTPLGDIEIDGLIANRILQESNVIDVDESAHLREHSIEVQLPFLYFLYGSKFKFVPICFRIQDLETSIEVGKAVGKALSDKNALVIASTDLTHYEHHKLAEQKDKRIIDAALKLDEKEVYSVRESFDISMCGYGPVVAAITAVKELGAKRARLLCYKTSGDVTGDFSSVVGYASIVFTT